MIGFYEKIKIGYINVNGFRDHTILYGKYFWTIHILVNKLLKLRKCSFWFKKKKQNIKVKAQK